MLSRLRGFLPQASSLLIGTLLAVLAVFVLAWVTFVIVRSGEDQGGQVTDQEMVAQSQGNDSGADTPAPEAENRNVDSYAAYEAKDPFRQIVEPADTDTGEDTGSNTGDNTGDGGTGNGDTSSGGSFDDSDNGSNGGNGLGGSGSGSNDGSDSENTTGNGAGGGGLSGGGGSRGSQVADRDRDGVSNRREQQLGLSPTKPDTDSDGIRDGADDSNGDGRPDRDIGARGGSGGNDGLFDSGGSLLPSGK